MFRARTIVRLAAIIVAVMPLVSCGYLDQLSAMRTFKDANLEYGRANYEEAVIQYGRIIDILNTAGDTEDLLNIQLTAAYFYIANSYDNLYKPARRGEEMNDSHLDDAIKYYKLAAEKIPNRDMQKLSMQFLVAAYGPDKANDPSLSEPVLRQMIQLDPEDPDNYFALAKLYEDSGLFEDAEVVYQEAKNLRPDDSVVYLQLAGFYNRAGEFELTIDALQQRAEIEPDNPEAFYTISTYYWEKAFRDFRITQEQKAEYIVAGLEAADQAINLNERYIDALVYKNILLRMQANMTTDLDLQKSLISEADTLRDRAEALQEEASGNTEADAA